MRKKQYLTRKREKSIPGKRNRRCPSVSGGSLGSKGDQNRPTCLWSCNRKSVVIGLPKNKEQGSLLIVKTRQDFDEDVAEV